MFCRVHCFIGKALIVLCNVTKESEGSFILRSSLSLKKRKLWYWKDFSITTSVFSNSRRIVGTLQFCIISWVITDCTLALIQKKTKTTTNSLRTSLGIRVLNYAVSTHCQKQYSSQCTLKGFMEIHLSNDASEAEYYHPHKWSLYQEGKKAQHQSTKFPNKDTGNGWVQHYHAEKGNEASWQCTADTVFLCCRSWIDSM